MNSKQTYELLQPIIAQINKSVVCDLMTDNLNGTYTFECGKTKWACKGYPVTILGNLYEISEVIYNQSITVKGSVAPNVLTFDLNQPHFKHGTLNVVAAELSKIKDFKDRLQLIWLKEVVTENLHFDELDAVDSDNDVNLFFLTDADFKNWDQTQGDTKAISPMRSLCAEVVKTIINSSNVAQLKNTGTIRNYNVFGNITDNGYVKNIFNEPLAGVGLKLSIPFLKDCDCCSDSALDNRPSPSYVKDSDGTILAVLYSNEYYTVENTGPCEPVLIKDQNNNTIDSVNSGGTYNVTVLETIKDTITANTATIIDNLN